MSQVFLRWQCPLSFPLHCSSARKIKWHKAIFQETGDTVYCDTPMAYCTVKYCMAVCDAMVCPYCVRYEQLKKKSKCRNRFHCLGVWGFWILNFEFWTSLHSKFKMTVGVRVSIMGRLVYSLRVPSFLLLHTTYCTSFTFSEGIIILLEVQFDSDRNSLLLTTVEVYYSYKQNNMVHDGDVV